MHHPPSSQSPHPPSGNAPPPAAVEWPDAVNYMLYSVVCPGLGELCLGHGVRALFSFSCILYAWIAGPLWLWPVFVLGSLITVAELISRRNRLAREAAGLAIQRGDPTGSGGGTLI